MKPDELESRNAEMTNAAAYFTGAAQRRDKEVKIVCHETMPENSSDCAYIIQDFFYMHSTNCSIFFPAFLKQGWLKTEDKVRLLEWKVRNDITMYASRGSPELLLDEITNYEPKIPSKALNDPWQDIFARVCRFEDDGHGAKLVRTLAHGQQVCKPYEHRSDFRLKGDMWLQLGHMAIDSVEATDGVHWVRGTGFDSAWEKVTDRTRAQL